MDDDGDDYDFGMSEDDLLYREMNPEDPWYMGNSTSPAPPRRNCPHKAATSQGRGSRWSAKKQFFMGMLISSIVIGIIILLAWSVHKIF